MNHSDEIIALLKRFKIRPTECRTQVLTVLLEKIDDRFTNEDIVQWIEKKQLRISETAVSNTLRLFCVRGIIQTINPKRTGHRGRPELLFIVSHKLNPPPSPYTPSPQFEEVIYEYSMN